MLYYLKYSFFFFLIYEQPFLIWNWKRCWLTVTSLLLSKNPVSFNQNSCLKTGFFHSNVRGAKVSHLWRELYVAVFSPPKLWGMKHFGESKWLVWQVGKKGNVDSNDEPTSHILQSTHIIRKTKTLRGRFIGILYIFVMLRNVQFDSCSPSDSHRQAQHHSKF